jgi:hypothetical protein
MAASGLITLTLALLMLRNIKTGVHDPAKRAYHRFCAKLARKNLPREAAEGPLNYAARLSRLRPDLAAAVSAVTRLYVALRYGTNAGADALHDLERRVRHFRT